MNEIAYRACTQCGNGDFKLLSYPSSYGMGYKLTCAQCDETLIEIVKCNKCNKKLSESDTKEYLQKYKDTNFNIHSILCAGCKKINGKGGQSKLF